MRFKVELLDEVFAFLRHHCTAEEKQDFQDSLRCVSESPISSSERHIDSALSPYELRRFRFGAEKRKIAIFQLDATESRIRVIECRLLKQKRGPQKESADEV